MKKIIYTSCMALCVTTLAACGANNNDPADNAASDFNQVTHSPGAQDEDGRMNDLNRLDENFPFDNKTPFYPYDRNMEDRAQDNDGPYPNGGEDIERGGEGEDNEGQDDGQEVTGDIHEQVVQLTNEAREEQGLEPLELSEEVSEVAQEKSEDMAENDYFSHTSPNYGSPFDMLQEYDVDFNTAAENIAAGQQSPEEVVDGWLNSSSHRKNIMNANMTDIGVGYEENGNYWTQMFVGK
ncbi:CAP domain-containing protein [Halobacillus sp. B23F22_1]|uniref:CAP domain-containing protein n=1 Tax=Halobacillus sp. B23F22_1 TaxID=3459514 RepID=UPI00373E9385